MSEWRNFKLSDVADVIDSMHQTPKYSALGKPLVRVTDLKNGYLNLNDCLQVTEDIYQTYSSRHKSQVGDIVFARVGSYGNLGFVNKHLDFCLGQNTAFIIPKEDAKYLYYYLKSPLGQNEIEASVGGSTQPTISIKSIKNFEVILPTIYEQKAISSVLSSLDEKIDLLKRQNKTLEAMAETLFRQWFIEEANEDWEDGVLGDIASNVRANATTEAIDPNEVYVGLEHIERRHIALSQHGYGSDVSSNKSRFKKQDILFGKLRPYFHKVCITQFEGVCSTDILVLRAKDKDWITFTLFAFFQDSVIEYANLASGGTRMPRADWGSLSQYPIAIPPLDLVDQFNKVTMPSIEKIHKNLTQIQTLEQLRDTLLPKLMNGEVRVQYQTKQVT